MTEFSDPAKTAPRRTPFRNLLSRLFRRARSLPPALRQAQTYDPGRAFELAGYGRGANLSMLPNTQQDQPR